LGLGVGSVFVGLTWRGNTFTSEPAIPKFCGGERDIHYRRRFILGVTQRDLDEGNTLDVCIRKAIQSDISEGPVAYGTKVVSLKMADLFKAGNANRQDINVGESSGSGHTFKWNLKWCPANDAGKPNFD